MATVNDSEGDPVPNGVVISFSVTNGTGELSADTATTTGGIAQVTLTLIDQSFIRVGASSGEISDTIDISCILPTLVVEANSTSLAACEETVITDENGQAQVTLTSGTAITATVDATYCGITGITKITFTNPIISVNADPATVTPGNTSTITALVKDSSENLVADGTVVSFSITEGTGILSAYSAITTNGQATITLTSDTEDTATIIVQASYCGLSYSVDITILQHEYSFTLSSSVDEIEAGFPCVITATLMDRGIPVQGEIIDFSKDSGTFSDSNNTTNADGQATVNLTFSGGEEGETATIEGVTTNLNPNKSALTTVDCIAGSSTSDFKVIHGNSVIQSGHC